MIASYYQFIALPPEVKQTHKIKSKNRLDCVLFSDKMEFNKTIAKFINCKNQFCFYLSKPIDYLNANSKRISDLAISNKDHITSLYFEDLDNPCFAYGDYLNEGLLFVISPDFKKIEMLVIPNGKNLIRSYYQKLVDSDFDQDIERLRMRAIPFFNYGL